MRNLLIALNLFFCGTAAAADLTPAPVVPPAPAFVGIDPFYVGGFAGLSLAPANNNLFVLGPQPTTDPTMGTLAGLVAGYGGHLGAWYYGAELSFAYDFNSACFGLDCAAERHPGWLFQQVGEFGYQFGNFLFAARAGLAERTNNLSAFDPVTGQRDGASGFAIGPDAGVKLRYAFNPHLDAFTTYDHVWWNNYSVSTPAYFYRDTPVFQNGASIKDEDIFKVGVSFH